MSKSIFFTYDSLKLFYEILLLYFIKPFEIIFIGLNRLFLRLLLLELISWIQII